MPNQPDPRRRGDAADSQRQAAAGQRPAAARQPGQAPRQPGRTPQPQRQPGQAPRQGAQPQRQPGQAPRQPGQAQRRPGQRPGGAPPPRRSENRWFRAIIMVVATIFASLFLAVFALQAMNDLLGFEKEDQEIPLVIPEGATVAEVSQILKESGVIDQALVFRLFAALKTSAEDINPGEYVLNSNMGYLEIVAKLESGITYSPTVTITFIEGWTLLDVANELEANGVCEAQEFLEYLRTAEYAYDFYEELEGNPLRFNPLEGYVFPDTYDFYMPERVDSVALKFVRNFNDKLNTPILQRIEEMQMSIDEVITLASIIQREAGDSDDMRLVSSVFHNRLGSSSYPRLQSDVTILYVETDIKPYLGADNQDMYDAYNTYVCEGLPVGPICNPGIDAITAALYPETTGFYFFVTDEDGEFYYASNASDHYNNVQRAMEVGDVHGIDTQ